MPIQMKLQLVVIERFDALNGVSALTDIVSTHFEVFKNFRTFCLVAVVDPYFKVPPLQVCSLLVSSQYNREDLQSQIPAPNYQPL